MRGRHLRAAGAGLAWGLAATATALGSDDGALQLADQTADTATPPRAWRAHIEWSAGRQRLRGPLAAGGQHVQRLSLDLRAEWALPEGWQVGLAPRLDLDRPAQAPGADTVVLTLREASLGRSLHGGLLLDAGRLRARQGVALGYNPTDLFREGSTRALASLDPASVKANGQGSVMLRARQLWAGGAAALMLSPRLGSGLSTRGPSLDVGATNPRRRMLASYSPALSERASAQLLAAWQAGRAPRWGLDATWLAGSATVAYLEWSGGRMPAQLDLALQRNAPTRWRHQLALGATTTTAGRLSLSAELQADGAALDAAGWRALRDGAPADWLRYMALVQRLQELPTRRAALLHASWADAFIPRLQLGALVAADTAGATRRGWLEARYHADGADLALQWQREQVAAPPATGLPTARTRWLLSLRHFL